MQWVTMRNIDDALSFSPRRPPTGEAAGKEKQKPIISNSAFLRNKTKYKYYFSVNEKKKRNVSDRFAPITFIIILLIFNRTRFAELLLQHNHQSFFFTDNKSKTHKLCSNYY